MAPVPKGPDRKSRLQEFVDWAAAHVTGDEKGESQIFLDRLFQAFGQKGRLDVGGTARPESIEFRIRKAKEDGGRTAFAHYVWKPHDAAVGGTNGTSLSAAQMTALGHFTRSLIFTPSVWATASTVEMRGSDVR